VTENDRFYDGNEGQDSVAGKDEEKAEYCLLPAGSSRSIIHDNGI
jgi:hypothetical protein